MSARKPFPLADVVAAPRSRGSIVVKIVLLVLLAALTPTISAAAASGPFVGATLAAPGAFAGRNGVIVFTSVRESGGRELYTVDVRGRTRQLTANSPLVDQDSVAWSPDGRVIAVDLEGVLGLLDTSTREWQRLPSDLQEGREGAVSWAPDASRFAFSARNRSDFSLDIWTVRPDGADRALVAGGTETQTEPAWSPDGRRLAFESDGDLVVTDVDGGSARVLGEGSSPAWSPDSRQLVAVIDRPGGAGLGIFDVATGASRALATCRAGYRGVSWAPASAIVYLGVCNADRRLHLYALNADGSGQRRIVEDASGRASWAPDTRSIAYVSRDGLFIAAPDGTGAKEVLTPPSGAADGARWAPDGRRLAGRFVHPNLLAGAPSLVNVVAVESPSWSPDGRRVAGITDDGNEVSILDTVTHRERSIFHVEAHGHGFDGVDDPAWSPDGRLIAVAYFNGGYYDVAFLDVRRARVVRIRWVQGARAPAWAPDSRRLAYDTLRSFTRPSSIYLAGLNGRGKRLIVRNGHAPVWSPDGKKIAFVRMLSATNSEIFVINVDGTGLRRLTRNPGPDYAPDWQRLPRK